jgi:hypothetical protein
LPGTSEDVGTVEAHRRGFRVTETSHREPGQGRGEAGRGGGLTRLPCTSGSS